MPSQNIVLFPTLILTAVLLGGCLNKVDSPAVGNAETPASSNSPPRISGDPGIAAKVGSTYSFTPSASDPDGDPLTFTSSNAPAWARFDTTTGSLTGQPQQADVGVYQGISISVSDGTLSATLPAFTLTVTETALGTLTIAWTAPTQNTDGTPLTDLFGYRIYYGLEEGNYQNRIDVDTAGVSEWIIENLLPDTYFVVATAVNRSGLESTFSNVIEKTVTAN